MLAIELKKFENIKRNQLMNCCPTFIQFLKHLFELALEATKYLEFRNVDEMTKPPQLPPSKAEKIELLEFASFEKKNETLKPKDEYDNNNKKTKKNTKHQ